MCVGCTFIFAYLTSVLMLRLPEEVNNKLNKSLKTGNKLILPEMQ